MLGSLLKLIAGRTLVRPSNVPLMLDFLIEYLKEQGFAHTDRIPKPVGLMVLEEALRRAAEKEKDGQPRSTEFLKQTK